MRPRDGIVIARVYKLTRNMQDAEDAVQSAYLYQLTHQLKRKHFVWKALRCAMSKYRSNDKFEAAFPSDELDKHFVMPSHEGQYAAKQEVAALRKRLSGANQSLLDALLDNNASPAAAEEATGIAQGNFKTLMSKLRKGQI